MTEFKGTKVKAYVVEFAGYIDIQDEDSYAGSNLLDAEDVGVDVARANARVFAEAINVANETGQTPLQLKERIDRACEIMKEVRKDHENYIHEKSRDMIDSFLTSHELTKNQK